MLRPLLPLLFLFAACTSQPANSQMPTPDLVASDTAITLAQAPQTDAPALAVTGSGLVAAWVGSDERGVHQDARRLSSSGLSDTVTLPLPPKHPYDQRLIPAGDDNTHLLWLDAADDDQTHFFAALLSPDLTIERGPVSISEGLALDYSAVSDGAGGLWAAWSGGLVGEMTLYVRRVDEQGRPLVETTTIDADAEHPALVRTAAGETWLFWLARGQVMRQRLDPPGDAQALTGAISLAPGDQLIDVSAALDSSNAYFFWNVARAGGVPETWFTCGTLTVSAWRQPVPLRISLGNAAQFPLRWTVPLVGQGETLAALSESDAGLNLVQFSNGALVGYRTVVPGTHLIGLPSLVADPSGALRAAWAAPGETIADLRLLTLPQ